MSLSASHQAIPLRNAYSCCLPAPRRPQLASALRRLMTRILLLASRILPSPMSMQALPPVPAVPAALTAVPTALTGIRTDAPEIHAERVFSRRGQIPGTGSFLPAQRISMALTGLSVPSPNHVLFVMPPRTNTSVALSHIGHRPHPLHIHLRNQPEPDSSDRKLNSVRVGKYQPALSEPNPEVSLKPGIPEPLTIKDSGILMERRLMTNRQPHSNAARA